MILKYLLIPITQYIRLAKFRSSWKKINPHNDTMPNNVFPINKVSVGKATYATLNVNSYRNPQEKLIIGNYCSISSEVLFILSGEHRTDCLSTFPFGEKIFNVEGESAMCRGPIVVEDDVWIGARVTVLSGVTIGQGSIIGANSIVTKDVPPYSVYVGNKVIKKRFSDAVIEKLMNIDYEKIQTYNLRSFYSKTITEEDVDDIVNSIIKGEKKND